MEEQALGALLWTSSASPPTPHSTPVSEEPGDQVGDRLPLHKALRPARRLPRGLLCTSTLSSSDLREVEAQRMAGGPQGQGLGPPKRTGLGWGKTNIWGYGGPSFKASQPLTAFWPPCPRTSVC